MSTLATLLSRTLGRDSDAIEAGLRVTSIAEPEPTKAPRAERRRGIPADTLRRLRAPVIEVRHADGTASYKDDPLIRDGGRISA